MRYSREECFRKYMYQMRSHLHPIVGREHFRVDDTTEHKRYYFGSRSEAYEVFSNILGYGNDVAVYYKEA